MKQDTVTGMEYSFRKKKATREEFPEDFLFSSKNP